MPDFFAEVIKRLKERDDVVLVTKALGSRNETRDMHVNRGIGESTSFLKPTALYDGYFEEKTFRWSWSRETRFDLRLKRVTFGISW